MLPNGAIWSDDQLLKALTMADMGAGGLLPRQTQDELVKYAISYTSLLGNGGIRRRSVRQRSGQLDQMWQHMHITRRASDVFTDVSALGLKQGEGGGSGDVSAEQAALYDEQHRRFGSLKWDTEKMVATDSWTTETLRENIENGTLDQALREGTLRRLGVDMADLALNGDEALAGTDRRTRLLKANNGWDKLTESANLVDAKGGFISRSLFSDMAKRMPRWFMENNPNLKWIFNTDIRQDWVDVLGGRPDAIGGAALGGQIVAPLGFQVIVEPMIPSDKALSIAEASTAAVFGNIAGPFTFTALKFKMNLGVDVADQADAADPGATPLVLVDFQKDSQAGDVVRTGTFTLTTTQVAKIINQALLDDGNHGALFGFVAQPDPVHDFINLVSPTTGVASTVEVQDGVANNALDLLGVGIDNSRTAGVADASVGATKIHEGTNVYLTDPRNFAWVVITSEPGASSDGVRVYAEYNKDRDRVEFIVYYNSDALVENLQAVVKANNVRTKQLTAI